MAEIDYRRFQRFSATVHTTELLGSKRSSHRTYPLVVATRPLIDEWLYRERFPHQGRTRLIAILSCRAIAVALDGHTF